MINEHNKRLVYHVLTLGLDVIMNIFEYKIVKDRLHLTLTIRNN